MTFQLDTSGRVECPTSFQPIGWAIWSDLTPFAQGYVEAMFSDFGRVAMIRNYTATIAGFRHLAPATVERIIADCVGALTLPYLNLGNAYNDNAAGGACYWSDRQAGLIKGRRPQAVFLSDDGLIMLREVGQ